ncbi:putative ribonuclease H-like domain-containing protein [Tanacetum coccineum]
MSDHNSSDLGPHLRQEMSLKILVNPLPQRTKGRQNYDNDLNPPSAPNTKNDVPTAEKTDSSQQDVGISLQLLYLNNITNPTHKPQHKVLSNLQNGHENGFHNSPLKEEVYVATCRKVIIQDHPEKVYLSRKACMDKASSMRQEHLKMEMEIPVQEIDPILHNMKKLMEDLLPLEEILKEGKLLRKKNSVLFTDTACVVLSPDFKLTDKSYVLLKVPKKDNMYSVDLKNVVPQGGIENLIDLRVKVIRCDNGTEFKNRVMNQFCEMKGIKREFSVARTPQQNGVQKHVMNPDNRGKLRMETNNLGKDYILLPMWPVDPLFSLYSKDSPDVGFKPSGEEEKKDAKDPGNEDSEVTSTIEPRVNQEKDANVNSTNNIKTVSPTVNVAGIVVRGGCDNIVYGCADDPNMPELEEIGRFSDAEDDISGADMNNLDTYFQVSPVPTTRIHKDHPIEQIIGDLNSAPQTRRMTRNLEEHRFLSTTLEQRRNHKDIQNCLFACFLSQEEPKKVVQALKDPSWIEAMQEELLQFKLQEVWTLVELPNGKRAIGTKWVFRNKKDERGIVIKNKARLVAQGYTQEEGIKYDEVFAHVARIEAIRQFLAYASFKDFVMYQIDVKSAFLYGKIEEELYQKEDGIFISQDKYVNEILNKFGFSDVKTARTPMETQKALLKDADGEDMHVARFQVNPKVSHLHAMKRIFRYLKGQPKLGLWYPKDSPFDLVAYTDSDYAGASLDRKSTTGGCQFLGCRLISWQCKKQTVVANSTTEAEYIAASNCCGQKKANIEIRHHFIRDSNEKKLIQMIKIHTDQNIIDLLTKAFDVSRFQYLIASIGMLNL